MSIKAYSVTDRTECLYSTIVFAETSGKAKALAIHTDACEDVPFTDISARRVRELDDAYRGNWEMDWCDPEDRLRMVRDGGYRCSYEIDISKERCSMCSAYEYCERAKDDEWL